MFRLLALVLAGVRAVLAILVGYLAVLTAAVWPPRFRAETSASRRTRAPDGGVDPCPRRGGGHPRHARRARRCGLPGDRVSLHLVADHCTDDTVSLARAAGVEVHERDSPPRGKGPALTWAIGEILNGARPPEVVVIVDADTIVAPQLLKAIDAAVAGGARAVQGQYRVRDPGSSAGAGLRRGTRRPASSASARPGTRWERPAGCTETGWRSRPTCWAHVPGPAT